MKKTLASAITTVTYLAYTGSAFATHIGNTVHEGPVVDPCTGLGTAPSGGFDRLCFLNSNNLGPLVRNTVFAIMIIATVIALFFLIWGGVKWILSGGDKAKVDSARSTIIAALVGLVITFLSFFILTVVLGFFGIQLSDLQLPTLNP